MDSLDPFSHPPGFMNLLYSQQETNSLEPNPYESVSPSIELGESGVPVFSTQYSEAPSQGENTAEDSRSKRIKWSPKEDLVLISAWLNTSKDPIVGNEQKADAFWKRIASYVASSQKDDCLKKREPGHCKQRWGKINDIVCKYVGCYEAATTQKASGQNDNDVMKLANAIYFNDHKKKFTLEHAWRELRHDQKWCASSSIKETGMAKRRKLDDASAQSSSSNPLSHGVDEAMTRPPSVKASKTKVKRNVTNTSTMEKATMLEIQSVWEIKQKDFALKEKLSKHKLLDSLISKTEPLDEIEMALKNKLITEMLSS